MQRSYLLLFALVPWALPAVAQHTSVLFIGNSYTYVNDLPNTFRALALSLGDTVDVAMSAPGGYTFEQHDEYAPTLQAIASRQWTYVVLQEQSQLPSFPPGPDLTTCLYYAADLARIVRENDECTLPVYYMTWGRENGDIDNCPFYPPVCTFDGMQGQLRERYLEMAMTSHAPVAPVGVAWKQVRDTQPLIDLYQDDGSHPTAAGTYLAACVFYSTLFHASSVGAPFISTVPQATATVLQNIASAIVLDSAVTWNLDVPSGFDAQPTSIEDGLVPNAFIFRHPGEGQHWWSCSNGETSTEAEPTFVLDPPGDYIMTHIYHDLCGHTDTATWTMTSWQTGIAGNASPSTYHVVCVAPGVIEASGGTGAEQLSLFDLQGRMLRTERLDGGRLRIPCPAGMRIWTIRDGRGNTTTGKLFVP